MDLSEVLNELRKSGVKIPGSGGPPTADDVSKAEKDLKASIHPDYRRFLQEAGDVAYGALKPAVLNPSEGQAGLVETAQAAWDLAGVFRDYLPFCEEKDNYYCLTGEGMVVFWSRGLGGPVNRKWQGLAEWIWEAWMLKEPVTPGEKRAPSPQQEESIPPAPAEKTPPQPEGKVNILTPIDRAAGLHEVNRDVEVMFRISRNVPEGVRQGIIAVCSDMDEVLSCHVLDVREAGPGEKEIKNFIVVSMKKGTPLYSVSIKLQNMLKAFPDYAGKCFIASSSTFPSVLDKPEEAIYTGPKR